MLVAVPALNFHFYYSQTLLRELEFKKPQLDELVNTAETLKSDANRLQLQTKGEFDRARFKVDDISTRWRIWVENGPSINSFIVFRKFY